MNRVTYFPPPTQELFRRNQERIAGRPYAKFFDGDLWLHDEAMPALAAPMDAADALPCDADGLGRLLDPGYHAVENGFCELPDGTGYVASRVPMPGVSGDMYAWWFWWHAAEPARYTLWYPHNHVRAVPAWPGRLTAPGLTHQQRYVGTTHRVLEFIGPDLVDIAIRFVAPAELGFDASRFAAAGIVGHACARVTLRRPRLEVVTMVHLARRTDDGVEQRSRYWIGHRPRLRAGRLAVPVDGLARRTGLKRRMGGLRVAYEQYLHDQIEFTHLSTFLPALYAEFA